MEPKMDVTFQGCIVSCYCHIMTPPSGRACLFPSRVFDPPDRPSGKHPHPAFPKVSSIQWSTNQPKATKKKKRHPKTTHPTHSPSMLSVFWSLFFGAPNPVRTTPEGFLPEVRLWEGSLDTWSPCYAKPPGS